MAGRKYLGVSPNELLLIYVTNLAVNNVPIGFGAGTDQYYANFQDKLVGALSEFPGRVAVKPYPAHRYADTEQIWHMPLPKNLILCPFGEFRHIRWAADVVLLDLCTSTFGWAMNSEAPVIFIDNKSCQMTDRAAASAKRSIFYFSSMVRDWEESLAAHLRLSQKQRISKWMEMADARREFNYHFLNGGDIAIADCLLDCLDEISLSNTATDN